MRPLGRIILLGPSWPLRGGISLFNVRLYEALVRQGIDTRIVGFKRQYPQRLFPGGSQNTPEPKPAVGIPMIDTCNPVSWVKTARYINALHPDAIVFSWWHFWFWPCYKLIAHMASAAGIPVFLLCHNYHTHDRPGPWTWFSENIMKHADGLFFLSSHTRQACAARAPITKTLFHPYYVWENHPCSPLENWSKKILMAGCIKSYKGIVDTGLELLRHDNRLNITIAGDVYETNLYQTMMAMKTQFQNRLTILPYYLPDNDLVSLMDSHDLLLCSHKKASQSGMAALAFGRHRPVVATPAGGLVEQIHPETGVVADTMSSQSLLEAVSKIYAKPPEYWRKGIRKHWHTHSFSHFSNQLCDIIRERLSTMNPPEFP